MNKPQKAPIAGPEPPPVSHLDEKITQWIIDFGKFLKRIWLPCTLALAVVLVVYLSWELFLLIRISKEEGLIDRAYALAGKKDQKEAKAADFSAEQAELDRLIRDARGAGCERYILKEVVGYLKMKIAPEQPSGPPDLLDFTATEGKTEEVSKQAPVILEKIEAYARMGKENFPQDPDLQAWSSGLLSWVTAEREFKAKEKEKRSFAPLLPKASPPGATPSPPSSSAPPSAPAAGAAPAAPAPAEAPKEPGTAPAEQTPQGTAGGKTSP